MQNLNNILSLRLCGTKSMFTKEKTKLRSLSNKQAKKLKFIIQKKNLIPPKTTIKVQFTWIYPNISLQDLLKKITNNNDEQLQTLFNIEVENIQQQNTDDDIKIDAIKELLKKYCIIILMEQFQPIIGNNIRFQIDTNTSTPSIDYQFRISFVENDCSTYHLPDALNFYDDTNNPSVATRGTINMGGWFDISTALHELGHAIGLVHEHQNLCGFNYTWKDKEIIYTYYNVVNGWDKAAVDNNMLDYVVDFDTIMSIYDPKSIMMYDLPIFLSLNKIEYNNNVRLSPNDVYYINSIYGWKKSLEELKIWYNTTIGEPFILSPSTLLNYSTSSYNILYIVLGVLGVLSIFIICFLVIFLFKRWKTK